MRSTWGQRSTVYLCIIGALGADVASGADWPMWRYDPARTGTTPTGISPDLHLQWVRELPEPKPAWPPDQHKLQFDGSYEPVVMGKTIFVPSMICDWIAAWDTDTGVEKWRFYADAPVRFAPVAWEDRVYFVSDDGYLYCVSGETGELQWRFRGGPSDRRVIGNHRVVSAWPARGAPVIYGRQIYFGASIWPFMGIFIHALDAERGETVWSNSGIGSIYVLQQHHSEAFAGVAPQGYFAATRDRLIVSGGRTVPAGLDRETGSLLYYRVEDRSYGKDAGGYAVAAMKDWYFNGGGMYKLENGDGFLQQGAELVNPMAIVNADSKGRIRADALRPKKEEYVDRKGNPQKRTVLPKLWEVTTDPAVTRVVIQAGAHLYGTGADGLVAAIDWPAADGRADIAWQTRVEGDVWNMLAADGKLFVVTRQGRIYCFGPQVREVRAHAWKPNESAFDHDEDAAAQAEAILERSGQTAGFSVVAGDVRPAFVEQLARRSSLHVLWLCPGMEQLASLRRAFDDAGLYGRRVAILGGIDELEHLPPYLANLVVVGDDVSRMAVSSQATLELIYRLLRPYGGKACFLLDESIGVLFRNAANRAELPKGKLAEGKDGYVTLTREGALIGAGSWTHQYGDAANSVVSADRRVRGPLGLLWFGGASNAKVLPRHGHGPAPQVVGGRLFIEGPSMLRAVDVYTGRVLWERELPGLGKYYDYTSHEPGANAIGSNYVSLSDGVYVVHDNRCLRLDPATGKTLATFAVPGPEGSDEPAEWGYLGAWEDLLIAGSRPLTFWTPEFDPQEFHDTKPEQLVRLAAQLEEIRGIAAIAESGNSIDTASLCRALNGLLITPDLLNRVPDRLRAERRKNAKRASKIDALEQDIREHLASSDLDPAQDDPLKRLNRQLLDLFYDLPDLRGPGRPGKNNPNRTASRQLVAMDRYEGEVLWQFEARYAFRHNAIAVGGGKVFGIDRLPDEVIRRRERRGDPVPDDARIVALDARSGAKLWTTEENVFGTWLGYSREHDVLVQAGSRDRDRLSDEVGKGLVVYRASSGEPVWQSEIEYNGPVLLHHDTLMTQGFALELLTGEPKLRTHPLTGRETPWRYIRNYGCNTAIASEHLLTFRSAAAGFYDLSGDSGTGNLGGFKSGCTSNLIVADGVLNAPDYTRTCTCSYQNQTSLAVVHDPDAEMWTFTAMDRGEGPIRRLGVNLGAPGDRLAENGVLWLEYPLVGGPSPELSVQIEPEDVTWFRAHALTMNGGELPWVMASGVTGAGKITIGVADEGAPERSYRVRMMFAEPEEGAAGRRIFDVSLQGRQVLAGFDVAREAGGTRRGIVKTFERIRASDELELTLTPATAGPTARPILCGVEIVLEE